MNIISDLNNSLNKEANLDEKLKIISVMIISIGHHLKQITFESPFKYTEEITPILASLTQNSIDLFNLSMKEI